MNRVYKMSQAEYKGLLKIASDQVPFGVYAVEKGSYAELRCDKCESITQLKNTIQQLKNRGSKYMPMGGDG